MRGTGTTSQQIKAAPKNAIYVWVHANTQYPEMLASYLGRTDLKFVGPTWLNDNLRGYKDLAIVIDHSAELTENQFMIWRVCALHIVKE